VGVEFVDSLAQEIRRIDGSHSLGAAALAEALMPFISEVRCEVAGWVHEDELPGGYPYDAMFQFSKVDIVRMFPVFVPTPPPSTT
jgi:hypothetical protein